METSCILFHKIFSLLNKNHTWGHQKGAIRKLKKFSWEPGLWHVYCIIDLEIVVMNVCTCVVQRLQYMCGFVSLIIEPQVGDRTLGVVCS